LLGFGNDENKIRKWQIAVAFMNHLTAVTKTKSYQLTIGSWIKNSIEIDMKRLRKPTMDISSERVSGRLDVLEELETYINATIENGQRSLTQLNEVENARTKRTG
jgi:hypothetical protein